MSDPRDRSNLITFPVFLFIACLLFCGVASAAPSITLSKESGPPTSKILVSGRGFEANVGVDIYFGTKDEVLVVTNGKGEFHNAGAYAPRSAHPGNHWVTALERNNDKGAQQPFLVQTNWGQFHFGPDHEGLNPFENVLNPRTVQEDLGLKWRFNTSGGGGVESSPAVADGVLYVGSYTSHVYALSPNTGALLWSYLTGSSVGSPAVANGVVYVGSADSNVYALNASTGTKLWSYTTGGGVYSSPAVVNGAVYVGSDDGNVYALQANTGAKLWSYATGGPVGYSSPAVADGVVYIGSADYNVYALKAGTGAKLWSYSTGDYVYSSPAVANGLVYFGGLDGNLYALDAITGATAWSYNTGHAVSSSPVVADGVVYVGTQGSEVYALHASSGVKLWSVPTGFIFFQSPAVANGVVYVGSYDLNLYGLDARTGAELWSYPATPDSSVAVANGKVYAVSQSGWVYAFGLTHDNQRRGVAKPESDSMRPAMKTLRPDFNLKVSKPAAIPLDSEL
jgi:outer membrane protein assembly factor BamB